MRKGVYVIAIRLLILRLSNNRFLMPEGHRVLLSFVAMIVTNLTLIFKLFT